MNKDELYLLLQKHSVPPTAYDLFTGYREDATAMIGANDAWMVFECERGGQWNVTEHPSESAACAELYTRLWRHFDLPHPLTYGIEITPVQG